MIGTLRQGAPAGVRLTWMDAGSGPLIVLLHGFPEFHYSWRHQVPALVDAGYRVLAPDLRGYNLSAKPPGVRSYRVEALVADVLGLIHQTGSERAAVVGHDWGGVVAWHLAAWHPEVVERLIILNAPHPAAYLRELRRLHQLLGAWYVFFFQLPLLPELLLRAGDFALLRRMLRQQPVIPEAFTDVDVRLYKRALAMPGALTAALHWYRAAFRRGPRLDPRLAQPLPVPTLVLWGDRDAYLDLRLLEGLEQWVPGVRIERLHGVSHWVQNDAPAAVNRRMLEFLTAASESAAPPLHFPTPGPQ